MELKQTAKVSIYNKTDFTLYTKPTIQGKPLSFDRSDAAESGWCGERKGVCACVWSPECHQAALSVHPTATPPWHVIQSEPSCKSALI